MSDGFSIQQLAREFGVTPRALRFYEDRGLLRPARRGRTRVYSDSDRVRLRLTLRGKRLGFSLEECREIIDLYDPSQPDEPRQLLHLLARIRDHRAALLQKLADVQATLKAMDEVELQCLASARPAGPPA
ncbi:MAG: MerR family DNA-binding transcriptional regulator [Gammaproteobacteria bacterium]